MNEDKLYDNESEKETNEEYSNNNNEYIKEEIINNDNNVTDTSNTFENKNDKLLNQIENNIIDPSNSQINNKLLLNEQNVYIERKQINKNEISSQYGNISNKNIVLFNKYVLGIRDSLLLFILTFIGMVFTFVGWIIFNNNFYSIYIYIIGSIPFFLTQLYFILSFMTEPGIIPRNEPNFTEEGCKIDDELKKDDDDDNKIDSNYNNNVKNIENENIQIKGENQNNEENKKNKISIPKIFTERKCSTCGIIRPPCASHCRYCDSCILNLDHHCFYISNCVGQRNHKYFYLFLLFGSISAVYITICNIILIFYIFIINPKGIWSILFENNKWILFLSFVLITFSSVYAFLGCINFYVLFGPSGLGILLFIILFYLYKPDDYEFFRNPISLVVCISSVQFGIFVIITFIKQTRNIGTGFTIKQNHSIQKEIIDNTLKNKNIEFDKNITSQKTKKEQFKNIIKFLTKKIDKSLIIPKRDLFNNK